MEMEKIAVIREQDEVDGEEIVISIRPITCNEGNVGYEIVASNGDDVDGYRPQSREKCIDDIAASWGDWESFRWVEN